MGNIQGKTSEDGKLQSARILRHGSNLRTTAERFNDLVQVIVTTCAAFWGRHDTTSIRGHIQQVGRDKCLKTSHGFATFNSTRLLVHGDLQQVPVCHIVRAPSTCQPNWSKAVRNQAMVRIHMTSQDDTELAHRNSFQVSQDASHSVMAWAHSRWRTAVLHHLKEWPRCQLHGSIGGAPRHPSHLASWKLEPRGYPSFDHMIGAMTMIVHDSTMLLIHVLNILLIPIIVLIDPSEMLGQELLGWFPLPTIIDSDAMVTWS